MKEQYKITTNTKDEETLIESAQDMSIDSTKDSMLEYNLDNHKYLVEFQQAYSTLDLYLIDRFKSLMERYLIILIIYRYMSLDVNLLYFSLIIPFALRKNELTQEIDINESSFVHVEEVLSIFNLNIKDVDKCAKVTLESTIHKYNSEIKCAFLERAESILKHTY